MAKLNIVYEGLLRKVQYEQNGEVVEDLTLQMPDAEHSTIRLSTILAMFVNKRIMINIKEARAVYDEEETKREIKRPAWEGRWDVENKSQS